MVALQDGGDRSWLVATADPTFEGPPPDGISSLAFGAALARAVMVFDDVGRSTTAARRALELAEAEVPLERALELFKVDSMLVYRAFALMVLASVRHGLGELPGARDLVERARELVEHATDPGVLAALLERTEDARRSFTMRVHPKQRMSTSRAGGTVGPLVRPGPP
jgi:hypothetical protein